MKKMRNNWKRNRANGEFWLAWADDSNRLHTVGANYYKLGIRWNHWRMGYGFVLSVSADEYNERNRIS